MSHKVLNIRIPQGNGYNSPRLLQYVNEHIHLYDASFVSLGGVITPDANGIYRVHVHKSVMVEFVKQVLTSHYGLEIERKQTKAQPG